MPPTDPSQPAPPSGPVAVLGADSPIGLTVIRELGEHGVPVLALGRGPHSLGRYSRHATDFAVMEPRPLAEWLPELARARGVTAIMAVSEHHLLELAAMGDALEPCKVLVPAADKLAIVLDKRRTLDIARGLGIAVPDSWQPMAHEDFARRATELSYPVAVKWPDPNAVSALLEAHGLAMEKVEYAADAPALLAVLERYHKLGAWPLVQTWCPGTGLGQMLHMDHGEATLTFQHRRLREWPPSGGVSSFCEAIPADEHRGQMALSERLLREIGWQGPAMVEYRYDQATGTHWLMEVNGRFWGSIPLAYHCGAHFAWETYRRAVLGQVPGQVETRRPPRNGIKARYVIPDARHLGAVVRDRALPLARRLAFAARFVAQFADPRVRYYVWSWRDRGPFFGDMSAILRKLRQR